MSLKKIFLWLFLMFSLFSIYSLSVNAASNCSYDPNAQISDLGASLDVCLLDSKLVNWNSVIIKYWFKIKVLNWVKNISIFLSIMAVGSIAYGALMMTISAWEDEKIKKWKDIVKWWIFGFLAIISAGWLIAIVINFIYKVA